MEKSKDSFELYSDQILSMAADIPLMERLIRPDITVTKRSMLCGSIVTIDLVMKSGIITAYSHDVRACALGQASASILAKDIIGKTGCQIVTVRNSVVQMLSGSLYSPNIFPDYQVLSPASQFKNRHESILLTLNATVEAIETIINTTKYQSR
ncbi:MAG: iron-sulfur cluster assembly scaffold protein [Saprospiraceae bacterium]|nr:iron-sulfur cluster assembly scaffold protein [Saprospiraceae bacterium]